MFTHRFLISVVLMSLACDSLSAQNIPDSCGVRDWFRLREKVAQGGSSLLCTGVVDVAFEHRSEAERELKEVIRKAPQSDDALDAHRTLVSLYFRHGQYREALAQTEQGLLEKPDAKDLKELRSMLTVLAGFRDLRVAHSARSAVQAETIGDDLVVPITIHKASADYGLDTGANISIMSESEAKRLGLTVHETATKMSDIGGTPSVIRLAEAPELWIGGAHLRNVAFAVFPDGNEPFVDLPSGHRGILGIPVLLALGSLRLEKKSRIVVGPAQATAAERSLPLAFDGQNPLIQIVFRGKPLTFTLDTGADTTDLYEPFADAFPALMQTGQHEQKKLTGVSGSSFQQSIVVPSIRFALAQGVEVNLAPAVVILHTTTDTSKWTAGNFGVDLLDQALPVTIDFRAMQVRFP